MPLLTSPMTPETSTSQCSSRQMRCNTSDYACIVTWLEDINNYNILFGTVKRPKINGNIDTKSKMLEKLAAHVNEKSNNRLSLTGPLMYQRLRHYRLLHIKAVQALKQSDAGLTEGDKKKGILTLSQKLDSICPHFERMDKIFGDKPNMDLRANEDSPQQREVVEIGTVIEAMAQQESRHGGGVSMEEGSQIEEAGEISEMSDTVLPSVERRCNTRQFLNAPEEGLENGRAAPKRRRIAGNIATDLVSAGTLERIAWKREKFRLMEESAERSRGIEHENAKALRILDLELKKKEIAATLKADLARQTSKAQLDFVNSLFADKASDEEIDRQMKRFKKYIC